MQTICKTLLIMLGLTLASTASHPQQDAKALPKAAIQKMDRQMTKHQARSRDFHSAEEFKRKQHNHRPKAQAKHIGYDNGYHYNNQRYTERYPPMRQRGHRYAKRGWILAYQYDRASFYDNEGYFYGYFNRHGYYFEGVFYRYDRYYTYADRIRGRGLFDRYHYMPANARYYGFCETRYPDRGYDRNYERGYNRY